MKIYTSYFYMIRFFKPNQIPLSTAVWPPRWFVQNGHQYYDKRRVLNGLIAEPFVPDERCQDLCRGLENCSTKDPNTCKFLQQYYKQLCELDFNSIMKRFENLGKAYSERNFLNDDVEFVLIFHETPKNPCSERWIVQKWFKENGYELEEYIKEET